MWRLEANKIVFARTSCITTVVTFVSNAYAQSWHDATHNGRNSRILLPETSCYTGSDYFLDTSRLFKLTCVGDPPTFTTTCIVDWISYKIMYLTVCHRPQLSSHWQTCVPLVNIDMHYAVWFVGFDIIMYPVQLLSELSGEWYRFISVDLVNNLGWGHNRMLLT